MKPVNPTKYKYVVTLSLECEGKQTKKAVRETIEEALLLYIRHAKVRVRTVDID